jgi:bacillopeptidase F (M6 metalloprotease family)
MAKATQKTRSSQWIQESIDLSEFAGQQVWIRFEYVTDAVQNGEGMLLDDIEIPEIGYFTDFEDDDGGWEAEGWVRVNNILPQTFRHALIWFRDEITVELVPTGVNNVTEFEIELGSGESVVVVVAGTTRFTRQLANYSLNVEQ